MELKFIFLTLLIVAGSNGSFTISKMEKTKSCLERKCASYASTRDPCAACRNQPINITDKLATQDVPSDVKPCTCGQNQVKCDAGKIIDRSICTPNGSLANCKCIPDPDDPCAPCRNQPVLATGPFAQQYYPVDTDTSCSCVSGSKMCPSGSLADATCPSILDACICKGM